ncbi:DUF4224 domain-containing protein [Roseateles puraquae]|uniref:DUF4224 domain-containing protein n=1 Tax=Roseateles puraquae TaxID=431059 RepID=UPI0031DD3456
MTNLAAGGRAIFALPDAGELLLTDVELHGLTGVQQRRLQIEWLKDNGWVFFISRVGRPVVGRLYANLKLAGLELPTFADAAPFRLNISAING